MSSNDKGGGSGRSLLPHHRRTLEQESAISPKEIANRGYYSIPAEPGAGKELRKAGINERYADNLPGIVIPVYNVLGDLAWYHVRFDDPPIVDGRARKYLIPYRAPMVVDVPRSVLAALGDPAIPLWMTEGSKKVDALLTAGLVAIGLIGVWNWRGTNAHGGKVVLPDFESIAFNGREVHIVFDSDVIFQENVRLALERFREVARQRYADVILHYLPPGEHGTKVGVDDFFAGGSTVADLMKLATRERLRPPSTASNEPDPEPTVPAPPTEQLLGDLEHFLGRYLILPSEHTRLALALFVMHTWALAAAFATPYIIVVSPEKRSGKTRVLEVLEALCRNGRMSASITAAALYQTISANRPTLLIDEADAIFSSRSERSEDLRGALNAGNRPGATVTRGTRENTAIDFDVYCPKVIAGVNDGSLPDTVADRGIAIRMQRKRRGQKVQRWRPKTIADELADLHAQAYAWAHEHADTLRDFDLPAGLVEDKLDDRAEEAWEPLFAIASLAGALDVAIGASAALAQERVESAEDRAHALLVAVHAQLAASGVGQRFTRDLLKALNEDEEGGVPPLAQGQGRQRLRPAQVPRRPLRHPPQEHPDRHRAAQGLRPRGLRRRLGTLRRRSRRPGLQGAPRARLQRPARPGTPPNLFAGVCIRRIRPHVPGRGPNRRGRDGGTDATHAHTRKQQGGSPRPRARRRHR
jgi:Domain of unknown function (DUF3854)/Protein of unknown function (DUF3631)